MDDRFTSTGPQCVEARAVQPFHSIRLSCRVDLVITQDTRATPAVTV